MGKWWQETVFYEIYVPSFKDGNGDGIGDFKGITEKLDYLQDLGIGAIWLTPFYKSPRVDNGYDISDYYSIDPVFGNDDDFSRFIKEAHDRNIRVIIDIAFNHTSTEHPWFKESASAKDSPKRDWYIWRDEPNNWESFFGGSAWEYDPKTKQYYYHSFAKEQADLNFGNEEVKKEIFKILNYWLQKGVDGFRLDVINNLTFGQDFTDNPYDEKGEQIHLYDKDQEGIIEFLQELTSFVKSINPDAFLVGEISSDELDFIARYAGSPLLDVTFNFNFGSIKRFSVKTIFNEMKKMEAVYQENRLPTIFFGSHDMPRLWNRLARCQVEMAELLATLILTARGVPFLYFGDEIGMEDLQQNTIEDFRDIQAIMAYRLAKEKGESEEAALLKAVQASRDKARAPMQWENEPFSSGEPWIPEANRVPDSRRKRLYSYYKKLIILRKNEDFCYAPYDLLELNNELLYFKRGHYLVLLNFGEKPETIHNQWSIQSLDLCNQQVDWSDDAITIAGQTAAIFKVK